MQIVTINKNDAGQRLDKFIAKAFPNMPKSMMYKFIRTKKIKRNRKRAEISDILEEGDTLQLFVSEEFLVTGEKKNLFKMIYDSLSEGGNFVNYDQFCTESEFADKKKRILLYRAD